MPNSYYNHGSYPATGSAATSASMRAELQLIAVGFDKLPTLAGNQNQLVVVNNTGTALVATGVLPPLDAVDNSFLIRDNADATRKFRFEVSTVTAGQTRVLTVPDANTTIVGTDTAQTLTNKTLTLPVIAQISNTGTLTLPTSTDTLVGRATTDTLTNKTLTAPVIATIVNTGTLTLPTSTDTLVGRATTDTLTNKSISGASNTLTNIANASLVNSAVTIGSTSLSLGGTMTTLSGVTISGSSNTLSNIANASLTNSSVTIGSTSISLGATVTSIAGLTLTTAAVNGTVGATTPSTGAFTTISTTGAATLASGTVNGAAIVNISASQTLTNKTISGSANTLSNIANASLVNSGLTIGSTNIALGATSTTLGGLTSVSSTSFTGALTGNASTATALQTARTLSIGGTGKSFDGTSNVTWATSEIAAQTAVTLANTRTLWGQNFNGSANVSGSLTSVGDITGTGAVTLTATGGTLALAATGANIITLATNGLERGRFTATGDFGLGTTTPTEKLDVVGTIKSTGSINSGDAVFTWGGELSQMLSQLAGGITYANDLAGIQARENISPLQAEQLIKNHQYLLDIAGVTAKAISGGEILIALGTAALPSISLIGNRSTGIFFPTTNTIAAATNGLERLRLDTNGHFLIGATSQITNTRLGVRGATSDNTQNALLLKNSGDFDLFQVRNDGNITTGTRTLSPYNNTTASAANMFVDSSGVLFRSTSSQKYKTDIQDATHGLAEVMTLRSVTYKGKTDGERIFGGFVAEEVHAAGLTEFVEYAEDGTPDALAYGHMVALLTKAIQELNEKIETLEAQVNQGV